MPQAGNTFQVLTANRLTEGEVVYRDDRGHWTTRFSDAAVFEDAGVAEKVLAEANSKDIPAQRIIDPYLFAVVPGDAGLWIPTSERERIRALGPTVRLDLGKQAAGDVASISA